MQPGGPVQVAVATAGMGSAAKRHMEARMLEFLDANALSTTTFLLIIAFGIYQIRRMRQIKGATEPSSLAKDGDPHRKQPV